MWLGYSDSNQEWQDQNLQCYHYTISQFPIGKQLISELRCKGTTFFETNKKKWEFFIKKRKKNIFVCSL